MDKSQLIIILAFNCSWSISYGLRLKTPIVDSDLWMISRFHKIFTLLALFAFDIFAFSLFKIKYIYNDILLSYTN